jgi:hypothetical protein
MLCAITPAHHLAYLFEEQSVLQPDFDFTPEDRRSKEERLLTSVRAGQINDEMILLGTPVFVALVDQ